MPRLSPGFVALLALALVAPPLAAAPAAPPASPNVVLILADDQGYGDLGCHGNPVLRTPHLDRLHAESVRLTDFHVTPLCARKRAALLTGRTSLRTGAWAVLNGRSLLRRDELTLADVFRANGYRSGIFGKLHLGENFPFRPEDRGYETSVPHGGGSVGGRDLAARKSVTDLMPSLVELCRLELPRSVRFDGLSLAPALRGRGEIPRDRVVITGHQPAGEPRAYASTAVMRDTPRLVNGVELYDLAADPAQKTDLAAARPEIVRQLRAAHDTWWREVEPTFADTPRIVVGDTRANPAWLTAWDMRGQCISMQHQVEAAEPAHGYWELELAAAGDYEFTLRRWPREVARAIGDGLVVSRVAKEGSPARVIRGANRARIVVGGRNLERPICAQAHDVTLRATLAAGPTWLKASFINDRALGGAVWGAYYVGVRKL